MPKDSQPDNKVARMEKCNYQTPITEEGHNHNPNLKHKSVKREGVSSNHYNPAGKSGPPVKRVVCSTPIRLCYWLCYSHVERFANRIFLLATPKRGFITCLSLPAHP